MSFKKKSKNNFKKNIKKIIIQKNYLTKIKLKILKIALDPEILKTCKNKSKKKSLEKRKNNAE